jgi:cell division septal protein FtsQ
MKKQQQQLWRPSAKLITVICLIAFAAISLSIYLNRILKSLDYFDVKDIIATEVKPADLTYLLGRNIFSLDLKRESGYISELYPVYRKVRLIRILPNELFVDFIKRKPVAYLRLQRDCYLDDELTIWEAKEQVTEGKASLPEIVGLAEKISKPVPGRQYNFAGLSSALEIIKEVASNRLLKEYWIRRIDIRSPASISFFIPVDPRGNDSTKKDNSKIFVAPDLEVKISQDKVADKINILAGLINQARNNLSSIQYVDLRFKEPVIRVRDVKK